MSAKAEAKARASQCGEWQDDDDGELFVAPTSGGRLHVAVGARGDAASVNLTRGQAKSVAAAILAWLESEAPKARRVKG